MIPSVIVVLGVPATWGAGDFLRFLEYEAVYPGIDLKYYSKQRQLEYDFDVAPHADPSMISFNMEGAKKIRTDKDGSLVLKTAAGKVRWLKPVAYQQSETGRQVVSAAYRVQGKRISFELGAYDSSRSLVIDPSLVYGTFLDGSGFERYNSFVVDSAGYSYIVGETGSSDFPTTPGAYQQYHTQNYAGEVFVSKLSQDGSYRSELDRVLLYCGRDGIHRLSYYSWRLPEVSHSELGWRSLRLQVKPGRLLPCMVDHSWWHRPQQCILPERPHVRRRRQCVHCRLNRRLYKQ